MKKKIYLAIGCFFLIGIRPAQAIIDPMAVIQSFLEVYKEAETKVQEIQKKVRDLQARDLQGFSVATSCMSNPKKCDVKALAQLGKDAAGYIKKYKGVKTVSEATELATGDLRKKNSEGLENVVKNTYIYKKAQGDDLKKLHKNRSEVNGVALDDVALLFAKGATTRNSIQAEDGSLYQTEFTKNNMDEILKAQIVVSLSTQSRLARILEIRAYMLSPSATVNTMQMTIEQ